MMLSTEKKSKYQTLGIDSSKKAADMPSNQPLQCRFVACRSVRHTTFFFPAAVMQGGIAGDGGTASSAKTWKHQACATSPRQQQPPQQHQLQQSMESIVDVVTLNKWHRYLFSSTNATYICSRTFIFLEARRHDGMGRGRIPHRPRLDVPQNRVLHARETLGNFSQNLHNIEGKRGVVASCSRIASGAIE